ncbi:signal transduction histidine kinase [Isoptericola sp. CG 20/1183]|uniref:histidine kinase n=1 Tax=Isoptericola halotolerans TaxID=300560 RepID=A0ABX5EI61_9MICO|nr:MULTISPECIES: histidine kinase [Isoptericola]PRZ04172.1 signal transduction histidine kinase [Isoptericola sp. CG 20/1183]PRZ10003.1 signal transduction histidine kinase [Isoptericola halotolerans]
MPRTAPAVDDDAGAHAATPSPWVTDVVLALAMALVLAVVVAADAAGTEGSGTAVGGLDPHGPGAYLFAAGFGALVLLRRRAPVVMLVATVLAIFAYYALGFAPIGMALPAVAALYSAAERDRTRWAVGAGAVLIVVATFFRVTDEADPSADLTVYDLVTNIALVAAAVALGVAVRLARVARGHTEVVRALTAAEQARAADQRLQAERMRIARDLHDVVGHNLSVVALHTSVATEAVGRDDDAARTALRHVREATSGTLHELRATVKVLRRPLRPGGGPGGERDERPGTHHRDVLPAATGPAGLAALVEPARASGLAVSTRVEVPAGSIDATVDAAAYRIVQEALTNVLRHSGARSAHVRLVVTDGRLRITVSDDGTGSGAAAGAGRGTGAGIAGMAERAALLGGTFSAGDTPTGGFRVLAELPARLEG